MCYQNVFTATSVQPSLNRRLSVWCAYRILRRVLSLSLTVLCVIRIHAFVVAAYRSLGPRVPHRLLRQSPDVKRSASYSAIAVVVIIG